MRIRFRATFVTLLSLFVAIACVGGGDQCLNPQPDLPSCRNGASSPGNSAGSSSVPGPAAGGANGAPSAAAGSTSVGMGGSDPNVDIDAGEDAGNKGDAAGGAGG